MSAVVEGSYDAFRSLESITDDSTSEEGKSRYSFAVRFKTASSGQKADRRYLPSSSLPVSSADVRQWTQPSIPSLLSPKTRIKDGVTISSQFGQYGTPFALLCAIVQLKSTYRYR